MAVAWLTLGEAVGRVELLGIGGATAGVVPAARSGLGLGSGPGQG